MHNHLCETHIVGQHTRERLVARNVCAALRELGVVLLGLSEARRGFRFERVEPRFAQALVCSGGRGRVLIGNQWVRCEKGQAYLTPVGSSHAYYAEGSGVWHLCWVMYRENIGRKVFDFCSPRLVDVDDQPLRSAVTQLYREQVGPTDPTLLGQWARLAHGLVERMCQPNHHHSLLWKLWERVDADLAHPWTVDVLAETAAMSNEHLRRLCLSQTGYTPMRYVAQLRMRRAAAMLANGHPKVGDVARAVGYSNAFAFSTSFKRIVGRVPSSCRQANVV